VVKKGFEHKFEMLVTRDNSSKKLTKKQVAASIYGQADLWLGADPTYDNNVSVSAADYCHITVYDNPHKNKQQELNEDQYVVELSQNNPSSDAKDLRVEIASFLGGMFEHAYIIVDELSNHYSNTLYPILNRVETSLRAYLHNYFVSKNGRRWKEEILSNDEERELKNKIRVGDIETSEKLGTLDLTLYRMDFGRLNAIISDPFSVKHKRSDLISQIHSLKSDAEDPQTRLDALTEKIESLQSELQSNYTKHFEDYFGSQFKGMAEGLVKARNYVAHNRFMSVREFQEALEVANDLGTQIEKASASLKDLPVITDEQVTEMLKGYFEKTVEIPIRDITNVIFSQLKEAEDRLATDPHKSFVGLKHFRDRFFAEQPNFEPAEFHLTLKDLERRGAIEIYQVENPVKPEFSTAAVRLG
tara:strand:+ start:352 stop:1599 length:1248 start_codon:yes stop_codon:yes gene_type:complete